MPLGMNGSERLQQAIEAKDNSMLNDAIESIASEKAEKILKDSLKEYDKNILAARGARRLTSEEIEFWDAFRTAARSEDYKNAVSGLEKTLPSTTINQVFDDLKKDGTLVSMLDVQLTNAKVKILYAKDGGGEATWGDLTGSISTDAAAEIGEIEAGALKLSAKLIISNAMLDLGAEYLDRFCRTILGNYLTRGIEKAVLNNLVSNTGPVGMKAKMTSPSYNSSTGVFTYTAKTALAVTEWTPEGLASVLAAMAQKDDGTPRALDRIFVVVNPADYWTKIMPATCIQNAAGDWVVKSPVPVTFIQSTYVTAGTAIAGVPGNYILTLCTAQAGKLEYSNDVGFLEDTRAYRIKLYGNGRPKDNTSFQTLNISGLKPTVLKVINTPTE